MGAIFMGKPRDSQQLELGLVRAVAVKPTVERTAPLRVANVRFVVDKLGSDCAPTQYVRELTQNCIEAIDATNNGGDIVWDVAPMDKLGFPGKYGPKLMIVDSGIGMTGEEMVNHINRLASTGGGKVQGFHENYGFGAKISALMYNPYGIVYFSWKGGAGSMCHLWYDEERGEYGLKKIDGKDYTSAPIFRPYPIKDHGTAVVLLGKSDNDNTTIPPAGALSPARWVQRYLNSKYFKFPDGIEVRARAGTVDKALSRVTGQKEYLDTHADKRGIKELSDVNIHWWILKRQDETEASGWSKIYASVGHVAFLLDNELYEMSHGKTSYHRLTSFGIIFGKNEIVIYIEPKNKRKYTSDITRSHIKPDGMINLPWADWGEEFAKDLPPEIKDHQLAAGASAHGLNTVESLQAHIKSLVAAGMLRPPPLLMDFKLLDGATTSESEKIKERNPQEHKDKETSSNTPQPPKPTKGKEEEIKVPEVLWVGVKDGTRAPGDMEDRAARYVPEHNLLLINKDFRIFSELINYWTRAYPQFPGVGVIAETKVRELVEKMLVETVLRAIGFSGSDTWTDNDISNLYSEETLTAVVLQVSLPHEKIKRDLSLRLGKSVPSN